MTIDASGYHFKELNSLVREAASDVVIENCVGQRFIGTALSGKKLTIGGITGNALGAYLNGAELVVHGNVQDAVGDTMNDGRIVIHGNAGDALGYAMRGGSIYVKGDAGYRTGIHMKEFLEKKPVIVVGGRAGSFLGEYLAGGILVVLNLGLDASMQTHRHIGMGMHGGKIFIRTQDIPSGLRPEIHVEKATPDRLQEIEPYLKEFTTLFDVDYNEVWKGNFYVLTPSTANPYKRLYTMN